MNKLKEILELGWEVRAKLTKEGYYMLYAQNRKGASILNSPFSLYCSLEHAINDLHEECIKQTSEEYYDLQTPSSS